MYDMHRTPSSSSQLSASPPASTSNPPKQSKADQIVQNFYIKVTQIITQARLVQYDTQNSGKVSSNTNQSLHPRPTTYHSKRCNKWFNLELWDSDVYKDDLKLWRHVAQTSTGSSAPLPMTIEFYLDTSELTKNQVLVLTDEILRRRRVDSIVLGGNDKVTKNIMLERWQLSLSHPLPDPPPDLPVVYKKSIAFFRSLYAYVRLLPAFRLYKRMRKMRYSNALKIGYRFVLPSNGIQDDIGIDVPIIEGETRPTASGFEFGSIDTPLGVLSLRVQYRTNCEFHVDESETLLSSKLMLDEDYFTPTMVQYYQRDPGQEKGERRKSVPTRIDAPGFLYSGISPQLTSSNLISDTPPVRPLSSPKSNPDLTFPKIYAPSRPANLGSNLSLRTSDSRRLSNTFLEPIIATPRDGRETQLPTSSSITTTRPNVTLVQPFKSSSLSSSPVNHEMNPPSPIFFDRTSTSPLYRSPSQPSLQQRNVYQSPSTRPLSINGGTAPLSSSVRSTSSAGSPGIPKFSSSFNHHKYERSSSSTRERDSSISSRRRSRSSLTNRSDGSYGSFNSSFFASLDPEDDIGEFVQMVMTREPLKMFSRSPTGSDDNNDPGRNLSGSVYRTQQQLTRFQKLREAHNNLPDSMTSIGLQTITQQLDPPGGLGLGTSNGSISSSSTMSSISKSLTHLPNIPSRLSEKVTTERLDRPRDTMPQPVRIPQTKTSEFQSHRPRRNNSITSNSSVDKGNEENLMQSDDAYPNLESRANVRYHQQQQNDLLFKESNSGVRDSITNSERSNDIVDGLGKSSATGLNIKNPVIENELIKEFGDITITGCLTGRADIISESSVSGVHQAKVGASNNDDDDLLFAMTLSEPNVQKNVSSVNDFHDQNLNCYHSVPLDHQGRVTVEASVGVDEVDNSNQVNLISPS